MKNSKYLKVLGKKIKVVFRDMTEENVCGHYLYTQGLIEINNTLDPLTQQVTLLHELVHAVFDRAGIHSANISHDIEEIIADQVSKVVLENFKLTRL